MGRANIEAWAGEEELKKRKLQGVTLRAKIIGLYPIASS